ncbi:YodC family protein [Sagittula salina]|uniref:DUF2158 domain-containing protein n=1 Tax=Sagittula salina TaxID=2820268 RepID=A0A940MND0_9RHOB|nr:DUF2158 domain-containing protein [Sagittula salina]MBP0481942.1 DUF2158 domain-containing protein [Sagittula salina]
MAELYPGDVVELASGGARMTVETVGQSDQNPALIAAQCVWFEEAAGEVRRAVIAADALRKVEA